MPTYSFLCSTCGNTFERTISFREISEVENKIVCPECHAAARRLFSTPEVVYKGNGWYSKDHPSGKHNVSTH